MRAFSLTLRILSPLFFVVAAVHLIFGLQADAMLGASVPDSAAMDPSLNSQNRFLGVAFALYGAVLYLSATDVPRYEPILKALFYIFVAAGLARVVSWVTHGAPAPMVIALGAIELLGPPAMLMWLRKAKNEAGL